MSDVAVKFENRQDAAAQGSNRPLSIPVAAMTVLIAAFVGLFPIGHSKIGGVMILWIVAAVALLLLNLLVDKDSVNGKVVKWATIGSGIVLLIVFPIGRSNATMLDMCLFAVLAIVVVGMNLTQGFAGQISMAGAAFMGLGAYTSVLLRLGKPIKMWGLSVDLPKIPFLATIPFSILVCLIFSVLLGFPALRVRGPWLAFVTLAFNVLIFLVLNNEEGLAGGSRALPVPRDNMVFFGVKMVKNKNYYYLILIFLFIALALVYWVVRSPWGRAFKALRDNPGRASSLGIDVRAYTLITFAISAGLAGMAGAFYPSVVETLDPKSFDIKQSFDFLLATVTGGLGTLIGPLIGVAFITLIPEKLRKFGDAYRLAFGLFVIVMMLVAPKGVAGTFNDFRNRLQGKARGRS